MFGRNDTRIDFQPAGLDAEVMETAAEPPPTVFDDPYATPLGAILRRQFLKLHESIKQKELTTENLIDSMSGSMQKAMFVTAMPLLVFIGAFTQDALKDFVSVQLRPSLDYAIFSITAFLLLIIIIRMRYKE